MAKMTVGQFLWNDKRSYLKRLPIAAAASLGLCFTLLFFGPIEIAAFNIDSLVFSTMEAARALVPAAVIVFLAMSFALPLLRGRVFDGVMGLLFGVLVACYVQGNFLGSVLKSLTGDEIAWNQMTVEMLLNLLLWLAIIAVPFVIHMFSQKTWSRVVVLGSLLLVVMQCAGLVSILATGTGTKSKNYYFSREKINDFSDSTNTVVFLLDRLDYDYIEMVREDKPDFFDRLDGFTSYTNAISSYARTRPGGNSILTGGGEGAFIKEAEDYFVDSWNQGDRHILTDLNQGGFTVDIYDLVEDMLGRGEPFDGQIENLASNRVGVDFAKIRWGMQRLSFYRYAPLTMKPFFWLYTDDVNNGTVIAEDVTTLRYEIDEVAFDLGIDSFTKSEGKKYMKFYHFMGSHNPYYLDENGHRLEEPTDVTRQTEGCFNILYRAFDKMKELGVYKDTAILVLADHGAAISDSKPLQKATRIGFFYKPAGAEGTPLAESKAPIALSNVPATILKACGLDYSAYGEAVDEVAEDADIVRKYYKSVTTEENNNHESIVYEYDIIGDAADFDNYKIVNTFDVVHWFF